MQTRSLVAGCLVVAVVATSVAIYILTLSPDSDVAPASHTSVEPAVPARPRQEPVARATNRVEVRPEPKQPVATATREPRPYARSRADRRAAKTLADYATDQGMDLPPLDGLDADQWAAIRSLIKGSDSGIQSLTMLRGLRLNGIATERARKGLLPRAEPVTLPGATEPLKPGTPRFPIPKREYVGQLVASVSDDTNQYVCRVGPGEDSVIDKRSHEIRECVDRVMAGVREIVAR